VNIIKRRSHKNLPIKKEWLGKLIFQTGVCVQKIHVQPKLEQVHPEFSNLEVAQKMAKFGTTNKKN
jgi:hypothetical protein